MRHKLQVTTAISQLLLSDESNLLEHFCITKINTHLQQLACTLGCTFHTVVPTLIYQWSALTFLHFIVSWYIDSISPHQQSVTSVFNSLKQTKQFFFSHFKSSFKCSFGIVTPQKASAVLRLLLWSVKQSFFSSWQTLIITQAKINALTQWPLPSH